MLSGQAGAIARATLLLLAGGFVLAACSGPQTEVTVAAPPPPPPIFWPTHGWQTSTPEAQGLDSAVLADAMETIREKHLPVHSLLIERHGRIVLDAYFYPFAEDQLHDVASVTKSVVSTLVGIAEAKQQLANVNTPVASVLASFARKRIDERKERLTLAHLLSMTSGLDCSPQGGRNFLQQMEASAHWTAFALGRQETAEPGTSFNYCAVNMELVSAVLSKQTGESAAEFAQRELFGPLGIEQVIWPTDGDGVSHGFADLRMQPRDMAKLGYLWLHRGVWDGRQIVPESYLTAALSPHAMVEDNVQYGYGMWIYPGHGHAGGPADFEANGNGGQRIAVVPSEDMVIVITGSGLDANDVASLIAPAPKSNEPLPPNPDANARLAQLVSDAANGDVRLASTQAPHPVPQPRPVLSTGS